MAHSGRLYGLTAACDPESDTKQGTSFQCYEQVIDQVTDDLVNSDGTLVHRRRIDTDSHHVNLMQFVKKPLSQCADKCFKFSLLCSLFFDERLRMAVTPWHRWTYLTCSIAVTCWWLYNAYIWTTTTVAQDHDYYGNYQYPPDGWKVNNISTMQRQWLAETCRGKLRALAKVCPRCLRVWLCTKLRALFEMCWDCLKPAWLSDFMEWLVEHEDDPDQIYSEGLSRADYREWRCFLNYAAIFSFALLGARKELTDIVSLLHPGGLHNKVWPMHCHLGGHKKHRIFFVQIKGEAWQQDFRERAREKVQAPLYYLDTVCLVINFTLLWSFPGLLTLMTFLVGFLSWVNQYSDTRSFADLSRNYERKLWQRCEHDAATRKVAQLELELYYGEKPRPADEPWQGSSSAREPFLDHADP